MKIQIFTIVGWLATVLITSVSGFERIASRAGALAKEIGVIHLIGEYHDLNEDIEQKKLLKKLANEGNLILGLEGLPEEEGRAVDSTVFGMEEISLNHIATTFGNIMSLFKHLGYKKQFNMADSSNGENEYGAIFYSPSYGMQLTLKSIWGYLSLAVFKNKDPQEKLFFEDQLSHNVVLRNLVKSLQTELALMLDGSGSIYKHIGENSINDNFYDNLSSDNREWYLLLKQSAQYFIEQTADEKGFKSLKPVLSQMDGLYEEIESCTDNFKLELIEDRLQILNDRISYLKLNLRNQVFLTNIGRAFKEKKHLNKPFFVIVGAKHVGFLKRNLIAQGYKVEVNGDVYDYSSEEFSERMEL